MAYYKRFTKEDAKYFNLPDDDPVIGKIVYVHQKKDGPIDKVINKKLNFLNKINSIFTHVKKKDSRNKILKNLIQTLIKNG